MISAYQYWYFFISSVLWLCWW